PDELKIKIIEESDSRRSNDVNPSMKAFRAKESYSNRKSFKKSKGAQGRFTPEPKSNSFFPYECRRCHIVGHRAKDCKVVLEKAGKGEVAYLTSMACDVPTEVCRMTTQSG